MKKKLKKQKKLHSKKNYSKEKKEINNKTNSNKQNFVDKYPGVIIGIVILIIAIILALWSIGATDPYALEKKEQAITIHNAIQDETASMIEALELLEIGEETYDDFYDDDYYLSVKEDLLWIKEKDNQIFNSDGSDLYIKEFAVFIFLNRLLLLNEEFLLDFYDFDEEKIIEDAKNVNISIEDITTDFETNEVFSEEENDKIIFDNTILELIKEYEIRKKEILNGESGNERKFVEAKKLLIVSYTSEN